MSTTNCSRDEVVAFEDFEGQSLTGWTKGQLDYCAYFTNFLGRFAAFDLDPVKTYSNIPVDASMLTLEFDFYEIDSWEATEQDCAVININNVRIPIGIFDSSSDEGTMNKTVDGIELVSASQGAPSEHCFGKNDSNSMWFDQKHHVTVTVPNSYFSNGNLTVKFQTYVSGDKENESAGYDNIKITAHRSCEQPTVDSNVPFRVLPLPTPSPASAPVTTDMAPTWVWRSRALEVSSKNDLGTKDVKDNCVEESKKIDVVSVAVDQCTASLPENSVAILSQDGTSVTFSVSQNLVGCDNSEVLSWIATDIVDTNDEIICLKELNVKCGHVKTYTAQCEHGVAVIDLFAYDGTSNVLMQSDGSSVSVPDACGPIGDEKKMCHFRYLVRCMPSMCRNQETKTSLRRV